MTTIASIATIPGRELACQEAVASLESQDCRVYVYNGELQGDAAKFNGHRFFKADYYLTCDDDLIYPPDYVERMVRGIEEYGREVCVTAHGKWFDPPVMSYYHDASRKFQCTGAVEEDEYVDVPGTGAFAWHHDTISFPASAFEGPKNMADIWTAIHCKKRGVEIVIVSHPADWIRLSPHVDHWKDTIWAHAHRKDEVQTALINEHMI